MKTAYNYRAEIENEKTFLTGMLIVLTILVMLL